MPLFWGNASILYGLCNMEPLFCGNISVLTGYCSEITSGAGQRWPLGEGNMTSGDIGGDDVAGIILKDRTTGSSYRVYVDSGVIGVEAV